jgi:outer membrane protein OmpA-like peptidoglycan-associated protein
MLVLAASLLPVPATGWAQTTVNPRALDQLDQPPQSAEPAKPKPPARPPRTVPPHAAKTAPQPPAADAAAAHAPAPQPPAPPQVRVPLAPPPPPELPPALTVPTRPPLPPTPATVTADAPGVVAKLTDGVRITFGEGRADLNPATEKALRTLAHDAPAGAPVNVTAFAPGTPEDPSTPRRLALSRALAARSILIAEGITSERIFVKALGAANPIGDGPADRVDVTIAVTNSQARSAQ